MTNAFFANSQDFRIIAAVVLLFTAWFNQNLAIADMIDATSDEIQTLIEQGVPVIDVRTPQEWKNTGVIPGSHLLTFFDSRGNYNVEQWLAKFTEIANPSEPVAILCAVGNRSEVIGQFLDRQMKYEQVYNVKKGIMQWIADGFTVEQWPSDAL